MQTELVHVEKKRQVAYNDEILRGFIAVGRKIPWIVAARVKALVCDSIDSDSAALTRAFLKKHRSPAETKEASLASSMEACGGG